MERRGRRSHAPERSPYHGWQRRWLVLVGCLVGIAVPLGALRSGNRHAELSWAPFASPDASFTVSFPGAPRHESQELTTPAGKVVMHVLHWPSELRPTNRFFSVSWADYPEARVFETQPEQLLEATCDQVIAKNEGRLNKLGRVMLEGHPGRELMGQAPVTDLMTSRVFLVGRRIYEVSVIGHLQEEESLRDIATFFGSLRLAKRE